MPMRIIEDWRPHGPAVRITLTLGPDDPPEVVIACSFTAAREWVQDRLYLAYLHPQMTLRYEMVKEETP